MTEGHAAGQPAGRVAVGLTWSAQRKEEKDKEGKHVSVSPGSKIGSFHGNLPQQLRVAARGHAGSRHATHSAVLPFLSFCLLGHKQTAKK